MARPERMLQAEPNAVRLPGQKAAAVLEQARLGLQYTTIVAPVAGVVGQRSVQPGQNVSSGQQLMTLVPLDSQNGWVKANFKETDPEHLLRPGMSVEPDVRVR